MPQITLPDGSVRVYEGALSALDVANDIGKRLGADALGCVVDGELSDLSTILDRDCALAIVTPKTRDGKLDDNALALIRHSAAHVMAEAIQRVVAGAELVYGPAVESGFYYDIRFPEERALREGDFERVESEMAKIIGVDTLAFISIDGLYRAMGLAGRDGGAPQYCDACFSGDYPIPLVDQEGGERSPQLSFLAELS